MAETDRTMTERPPPSLALSIVIPVYNGAGSVAELVGAIEKLSIEGGHEIILVIDGSPDNSARRKLQILHPWPFIHDA